MILDEIFAKSKADLECEKEQISYKKMEEKAAQNAKFKQRNPQNLFHILRKNAQHFNIIAEVKKASPSKGVIRADFSPIKIAQHYAQNNATAISVLTEKHYFKGDLAYLQAISEAVNVPLLRKDFIFDEYQILQSLASGADFILLIARMLEKTHLQRLAQFAQSIKLEILFEIHSEEDLEKALFANANIIGLNHRDLNDFSINYSLCERLLPLIPQTSIIVAESGLNDKKELLRLDSFGVDAFLIGEYFMRQSDEGEALKKFVERT